MISDIAKKKSRYVINLLKITSLIPEIEDYNEELIITDQQKIKQQVVKIFQIIDSLDQYTDPRWFLELSLKKMQQFYKELEDIWNYRLNLSKEMKSKIYPPNGHVFKLTPHYVASLKSHRAVSEICLQTIEKLVTSAEKKEDRVNGSIYVLFALTIVSHSAAQSMPIYYSMVGNNIQINSENSYYYSI